MLTSCPSAYAFCPGAFPICLVFILSLSLQPTARPRTTLIPENFRKLNKLIVASTILEMVRVTVMMVLFSKGLAEEKLSVQCFLVRFFQGLNLRNMRNRRLRCPYIFGYQIIFTYTYRSLISILLLLLLWLDLQVRCLSFLLASSFQGLTDSSA